MKSAKEFTVTFWESRFCGLLKPRSDSYGAEAGNSFPAAVTWPPLPPPTPPQAPSFRLHDFYAQPTAKTRKMGCRRQKRWPAIFETQGNQSY